MRTTTTKLEPGQHSIDRVTPYKYRGKWQIKWRMRLHDGRVLERRTQGKTIGAARSKARALANELVQTGASSDWKRADKAVNYLKKISIPAMEKTDLRPRTRARYRTAFDQLIKQLDDRTIDEALRFRTLETALQNIAKLHGTESARHVRTVLGKYMMQQLIRDEIIESNPLMGMDIDLTNGRPTASNPNTAKALTKEEWTRVIDHLLALDPSEDVSPPPRGRWALEHIIAKRRNTIDITLLQATTGLRITEARQALWEHTTTDANGLLHIEVTPEVSKTRRGRTVPVLDQRVSDHLLSRKEQIEGKYIVGAPINPNTEWERRNTGKSVSDFYDELAETLEISTLQTRRTHVWRATLNTLLTDVNEVQRSAFFGHTIDVNRSSYTDTTDTTRMIKAAGMLVSEQ